MRFGKGYDAWTGGHGFGGRHRHGGPDFMGHEGRGGRRRVFDGSELKLVLLRLIADQPRHEIRLRVGRRRTERDAAYAQ